MPRFNPASERQWTESAQQPQGSGWERCGLYNPPPRKGEGKYTTLVRHKGPTEFNQDPFSFEWEIFLLAGDLEIDGRQMVPGDHCVIAAGERIAGRTASGCEHLIIGR